MRLPSTKEKDFHKFFRLHPEFLYKESSINHWSEPTLVTPEGKKLKPDFILKSISLPNRPWSWQVVDLKRANAPLFSNKNFHVSLSYHIHRVVQQLRDYLDFFRDPRNKNIIQQQFGYSTIDPRLVAVIGRLPNDRYIGDYDRLKNRILDVSIMTYDEVLEDRRCMVERWSDLLE